MYRRDLLKAEIENLQKLLSQLMQLKLDGDLDGAKILFDQTIEKNFGLTADIIDSDELENFKRWMETENLGAEKLDSLAEFMYYELGISAERNKLIAPKLNLVYDLLSDKYKIVHLINLHRREHIEQYL